jgi:thiol-disulfide isomerase/thioredoxin
MDKRWLLAAGLAVALAAVVISGRGGVSTSGAVASAGACEASAKPANFNFTLKDVDNKDVNLASFKGKVVLLDFWATWCGPCKIEIPWFMEFQQKYKDKGFVVVGISSDDTLDKLQPFVAAQKFNYVILQGLDRDDVHDAFGPIWGLPTTYLISREGKLCKKHMGLAPKEQFEKEILGLL